MPADPHERGGSRRQEVRPASNAIAQPEPTSRRRARRGGAGTIAPLVVSRRSAFACCSSGALTVWGTIPVEAGKKNAEAIPRDDLERREVPDLGVPRQDQGGAAAWAAPLTHVRADQDEVARQPVGPDAADQDEDDLREPGRRQDEAEVGRRAVEVVEDGERERDRCDRAAEVATRPTGEEKPELALAKRR